MLEAVANLFRYAAPVALAATGETVGQKAGLLNIGLEGAMLSAAYVALLVDQATGIPELALAAGVLTAMAIALVQAWYTLRLGADPVVVGTAVNLGALGVTSSAYRFKFGGSGQLLSVPTLPQLGGWDIGMVLSVVLAVACALLLHRTSWGLAARAAGEHPPSATAAGLSVLRLRLQASLIGSGLAGLGGAYLTVGVVGSFAEGVTAGRGFLALAIVSFGRWKPPLVVAAALLVGAAEWAQYALQSTNLGIPSQLSRSLPYLLAVAVLVLSGRGGAAPAALGQPYEEGR